MAIISARPTADQSEKRPPTQSQSGNTESSLIPNCIDERASVRGEVAFVVIGVGAIEVVSDNELDHGVSQEFESFVVHKATLWVFVDVGTVNKRLREDGLVGKRNADGLFEWSKVFHK
jgi:hypothetical protein